MPDNDTLIWYASYGSNLSIKRFMRYINGSSNKTPPRKEKGIKIYYPMYFAKESGKWDKKGVAFIDLIECDEANSTLGRMYLVSKDQFEDVVGQENGNIKTGDIDFDVIKKAKQKILFSSWYGNFIYLGDENKTPIFTFTSAKNIANMPLNAPSRAYIQTISTGLKEAYNLKDKEIVDYLIQRPGIKGNISSDDLVRYISVN